MMQTTKTPNQNLTPEEWKKATDYALMLGDKMSKAVEQESEEKKCKPTAK
jgi:hypothetical protein